MNKVWSVTINGKNDCALMPEFQLVNVKLKFSDEDFEMYDMTTSFV